MDTLPLERLRRQHAAGLGVPEDRVELVRLDLDILSRMGTFVRIYAGGLTIFSTRATWAELGVPQQSARQLRYRRPPKDLVPRDIPEWFRSAAQRARDGLNAVSVEVAFLHPYRWVGYRDWAGWLADFQRIQAAWEVYRQEQVLDRYDKLMQLLVEDFQRSAREAHAALAAAGEPELPLRDDFVSGVVSAAVARMPTPQRIRERLLLDYFTPAVVRPALLEEELAQRDRVRQEREHQIVLIQLEHQAEADARLAEMEQQRLEHFRQQVETMALPLEQVLAQLRREVDEVAQGTLEVLQTHGGLRGRAGERVQNLARHAAMLDPLGDETLMGFVREAAGLVRAAADETGDQAAARVATLEVVLRQIRDLIAAGQEARRAVTMLAEESPQHRWRSICLSCRHVWASMGSLEPVLCPRCKSNRIAGRQEK